MNDLNADLLTTEWTFYEHIKSDKLNYDKCTKKLCTVDTVKDFWNVFNCIYSPVELFFQKETGKPFLSGFDEGTGINTREISSLSMFKNGIEPKWEDPNNKNGGFFVIKKFSTMDPINHINKLWMNLCIFAISNSEGISGARVVDSSQISTNKALYRVELWISNVRMKNKIENALMTCVINGSKIIDKGDKLEFKEHLIT